MNRSTWLGHGLEEETTQAGQDGWSDESVEKTGFTWRRRSALAARSCCCSLRPFEKMMLAPRRDDCRSRMVRNMSESGVLAGSIRRRSLRRS